MVEQFVTEPSASIRRNICGHNVQTLAPSTKALARASSAVAPTLAVDATSDFLTVYVANLQHSELLKGALHPLPVLPLAVLQFGTLAWPCELTLSPVTSVSMMTYFSV